MTDLLLDLRFALRRIVRRPGFSLALVLVLALGVGAAAAIFGLVDAVLLQPLPIADAERVMVVWEQPHGEEDPGRVSSYPGFESLRERAAAFEEITVNRYWKPTLTGQGDPATLDAVRASAATLDVLGLETILGTGLPADDSEEAAVVLTHRLWRGRFGGDAALLGRTITLNGNPYRVAGVLPPGREIDPPAVVRRPDLVALMTAADRNVQRGNRYYRVLGKLRPGVAPEQARAELAALGDRLAVEHPDTNEGWQLALAPLRELAIGPVKNALLVLMGAALLVLVVTATNAANLVLASTTARIEELGLRTALGADRRTILRQIVLEILPLVLLGVAGGALLATWGLTALSTLLPEEISRLSADAWHGNGRTLGFLVAVAAAMVLFVSVLPAFQAAPRHAGGSRSGGARRSPGGGPSSLLLRHGLVVGQLAVSVVLLAGAGLLGKSFLQMTRVDPGFEPEGVLAMELNLPFDRYPGSNQASAFSETLLEQVRDMEGVRTASHTVQLPLQGSGMQIGAWPAGRPAALAAQTPDFDLHGITTGFFRTLGIPLHQGRDFTPAEVRPGGRNVALLNRSAARQLFGDRPAVGERVMLALGEEPWEIVGVVGDVRQEGIRLDPRPAVYVPYGSVPFWSMDVVVRTAGPPTLALAERLRETVHRIDPALAVQRLRPLEEALAEHLHEPRSYLALISLFAALALLLALVGTYGLVAYVVSLRRHEIGVRLALGATRSSVLRRILRSSAVLALLGLALGLAGAVVLGRSLGGMLYQVATLDPAVLAAVALSQLAATLAATWVPATRAARVDPAEVLRTEA